MISACKGKRRLWRADLHQGRGRGGERVNKFTKTDPQLIFPCFQTFVFLRLHALSSTTHPHKYWIYFCRIFVG
jgi:competence transcription factor ComK